MAERADPQPRAVEDPGLDDEAPSTPAPYLLRSIRIQRFRSLEDVRVELPDGMAVLTGENDGGKTAFLDAIAFLLGEYSPEEADITSDAGDGEGIEVVGTFISVHGEDQITLRSTHSAGGRTVRQVRERVHEKFGSRPEVIPLNDLRTLFDDLGIPSPGGTSKAPFVDAANKWIADQPDEDFVNTWNPVPKEVDSRLPDTNWFRSTDVTDPYRTVSAFAEREVHRLLRESDRDEFGDVSKDLKRTVAKRFGKLRTKLREHVPEFADITLDAEADFTRPTVNVTFSVRRDADDPPINFDKEGEGIRRRFTIAIHESDLEGLQSSSPDVSTLLAYDEPDTHLDYGAQRELFDILRKQAELPQVQVVIATHSRNFIDRVPLPGLLHLVLDDERHTEIEVLAAETQEEELRFLASVSAGLGLRNSILLDERCFLVVEGDTEEYAVPELFRAATGHGLTGSGITLINTKGTGAVRRLVDMLVQKWHRDIILLVDNDAREDLRDRLDRWALFEDETAFFIGSKEFEDAFSDEHWVRALNQRYPKADGTPWREQEIASLRDEEKFSDALTRLVASAHRGGRSGSPISASHSRKS